MGQKDPGFSDAFNPFSGPPGNAETGPVEAAFELELTRPPPSKKGSATLPEDAGIAQLAEQLFCKQQVTGSIPVAGSTRFVLGIGPLPHPIAIPCGAWI